MVKPGPKPKPKTLTDTQAPNSQVVKRKPGRPAKDASQQDKPAAKRRGRPPKIATNAGTDGSPAAPKQAKQTAPKRRGRPPKVKTGASETTKQHQEQAQSSQVHGQDSVVLEVVGTSIQPSFVIQDPSSPRSLVLTEASPGSTEGLLSKLPSRKEAKMAKKLAVKRTQAMKKSTAKKVSCSTA